jgi:transcriptional regulator with XRE-family HTH domain
MARQRRGLSTRELGDLVNVSSPQVSRWERDLVDPRLDEAFDLCAALDMPITWLVEGIGATPMAAAIGFPDGFRTENR